MNYKFKTARMLMRSVLWAALVLAAVSCSKDAADDKGGGNGQKPDPEVVKPSDLSYELSPSAVLVPEATAKAICNVDTVGCRFTIPLSAGKPEVGQCLIVNTPTSELPYGLLAKVKGVRETADGYEVSYEDAELKDAFKTIDIPEQAIPIGQYVQHVYTADGKEVAFSREVTTRASGVKEFTIVLPEISWKLMKGLELTPKMTIDLVLRYVMYYADFQVDYLGAKVDAKVTLAEDLAFTLDDAILENSEKLLLSIICGGIPVGPVVITPSIEVSLLFKADGKVSLEASISYTRTLHANIRYQAKGGFNECSLTLDPEAPDALKFTFGPKFEGGFSVGLLLSPNFGIYHKALALRARISAMLKETISGKIDLAAYTGTTTDYLTDFSSVAIPWNILDKAKRLKYGQLESLMLNQALVTQLGVDVIYIGKRGNIKDFPEMSIPIDSEPIFPQVKIEDNDFLTVTNGNDVTFTLHHPSRSVFDGLTDYRLELKDAKGGSPIVKYFNFDDDIRVRLKAQIENDDVTTNTMAKLDYGETYEAVIYMNVLSLDIPVFKGTLKIEKPKVEPSELAFKAGGDTQQAKITKGIYRYCGVDIPAACSSWLSAKVNDDGTVSFTAKANHDGADRKVTVNCWVSSVKTPEDGEKELLPVTITQPASYDYEIESVGIIMHAVVWQSQVSFKASDEGVTITPTDKGVSVTFRQSGRDTGANAEWESLIKFSVDDLSLFESKQATLTNFSFETNRKGGEYNYYGDHVDWTKSTISMSANTSVMQSASGAWYMSTDNLSYHSNSTIHYDKWRKDAYSPPTEHTYTETVSEPYQGTSVSVFLSVKKK